MSASIKLSTDRLQAGLYIKLPLKWREHPFILNRFQIESDAQAKLIRSLPTSFVYYYPDKSTAVPLPALAEKKKIQMKLTQTRSAETKRQWSEKNNSA
ncbi:DUF3391 domain-containing protein [Salinivibrio costicola]|uniref:DUF3391 domain-containing protein n=1 Tax=Salinivibrio costicola TaxID=51367 RepID=UPI003F6F56C3